MLYDTPIWAQFATALEPGSVGETTVFLKLDTVRLPAAITWDAAARRIRVAPGLRLELSRTYTIEFSPELRSAGGARFGRSWFWQFTTNSLRRPAGPLPADGASDESPVVTTSWAGNDSTAGGVRYELFRGADSAQVAARALPAEYRGPAPVFMPWSPWPLATTSWWAVTAVNGTTGERLDGPTWRLGTLDPLAHPVDSTEVVADEWGWQKVGSRYDLGCNTTTLRCSPSHYCTISWATAALGPRVRLAGARLELSVSPESEPALSGGASLWLITAPWPVCQMYLVAPATDEIAGPLAEAVPATARTLRFSSDRFTAHLEAGARRAGFRGYILRSPQNLTFLSPTNEEQDLRPVLMVYYYR